MIEQQQYGFISEYALSLLGHLNLNNYNTYKQDNCTNECRIYYSRVTETF